MSDEFQRGAIEAILMVAPDPIPLAQLSGVIEKSEADTDALLREMSREYADDQRGFQLREVGGGWRMYSHPRYAEVVAIRGVEVDSVVRTLVTRGLIEQVGQTAATGASLYATTPFFLEKMGMNSLDELAPLAPYLPDDIGLDDLEKELR